MTLFRTSNRKAGGTIQIQIAAPNGSSTKAPTGGTPRFTTKRKAGDTRCVQRIAPARKRPRFCSARNSSAWNRRDDSARKDDDQQAAPSAETFAPPGRTERLRSHDVGPQAFALREKSASARAAVSWPSAKRPIMTSKQTPRPHCSFRRNPITGQARADGAAGRVTRRRRRRPRPACSGQSAPVASKRAALPLRRVEGERTDHPARECREGRPSCASFRLGDLPPPVSDRGSGSGLG
jgi:hypothetical protein